MFTINIYLRFALIAFGLIGGIIMSFVWGFWYGFPFWFMGLILLVGYILLGTVQSASKLMQDMDFDAAEQRLGLTWKPEWLFVSNKGYYYILKGSMAGNRKDNEAAEMWFKKAEQLNLPTENEKAMIQLQLANLNAAKNKWNAAQMHYKNAKKYKISEPMLKEQMQHFEKAMSNRGQMKHLRQGGKNKAAMIPGGKRRRPKMR